MTNFSQLGHAVKVKHLMLEVIDHEGIKDTSLRPSTESFSLFIKSWITNYARSSIYNIGERLRYALDDDIIFRYQNCFLILLNWTKLPPDQKIDQT